MKRLSSLLLGSIVLAASSLGIADTGTVTMVVKASSFDTKTGVLTGTLPGGVTSDFLRTSTTVFKPTDPTQLPPGPCRAISKVWNLAVKDSAPRFVFDVLMFDMAIAKCSTRISIPGGTPATGGTAPPIVEVSPGN
jgi:hypothetical protein